MKTVHLVSVFINNESDLEMAMWMDVFSSKGCCSRVLSFMCIMNKEGALSI